MTPFQHFQICLSQIRFYLDKLFVGLIIPTATIALSDRATKELVWTSHNQWTEYILCKLTKNHKITFSEYGLQIYAGFTDFQSQNLSSKIKSINFESIRYEFLLVRTDY